MTRPRVVIVTGLSGSGKSTAIKALEDLGFFCADNLPVVLLPTFLDLCGQARQPIPKVALGMDLRERAFFDAYPAIFGDLQDKGYPLEVLFLEASDDELMRRFKATRRRHPVQDGASLREAIVQERAALGGLKERATHILDTSTLTVHELRQAVMHHFGGIGRPGPVTLTVVSFGYRYGLPAEADLVFDVRFLPNPFFVPHLAQRTGEDPEAAAYALKTPEASIFLDRITEMLRFLLPLYGAEGRGEVTVALGCTGGRHRSVTVAREVARILDEAGYAVRVHHRDILRPEPLLPVTEGI